MASRRRAYSEAKVLETLLWQGVEILCFRCRKPITVDDLRAHNVEREHLHEVELDGPDEPFNCRYSHKARPCHATVTHGSPATFAGSSRHRIAKAKDPERIEKFRVKKKPLDADLVSEPMRRCRGCGQNPEDCICQKAVKRPAFGRR